MHQLVGLLTRVRALSDKEMARSILLLLPVLLFLSSAQLVPSPSRDPYANPNVGPDGIMVNPSPHDPSISPCSPCRWRQADANTNKFYPCAAYRGPIKAKDGQIIPYYLGEATAFFDDHHPFTGYIAQNTYGCWGSNNQHNASNVEDQPADPSTANFEGFFVETPEVYGQFLGGSSWQEWSNSLNFTWGLQPGVKAGFCNGLLRALAPAGMLDELVSYQAMVAAQFQLHDTTPFNNETCYFSFPCQRALWETLYNDANTESRLAQNPQLLNSWSGVVGGFGTFIIIPPSTALNTRFQPTKDQTSFATNIESNPNRLSKLTTSVLFFDLHTGAVTDTITLTDYTIQPLTPSLPILYTRAKARCTASYDRMSMITSPVLGNMTAVGFGPWNSANPCLNGGSLTLSGLCRCVFPWAGTLCQLRLPSGYSALNTTCAQFDPCNGHGVCQTKYTTVNERAVTYVQCACTPSWVGSDAGIESTYTGEIDMYSNDLAFCDNAYRLRTNIDPAWNIAGHITIRNGWGQWTDYNTPAMYLLANQCMLYVGKDQPDNWHTQPDYPLVPTLPFTCINNATLDTNGNPTGLSFGGPECDLCKDPCNPAHGRCTASPDQPFSAVCVCDENYVDINSAGCFTPLCPVPPNNQSLGACGWRAGHGSCLAIGATLAVTGYLSRCSCSPGWSGDDCNTRVCVTNSAVATDKSWAANSLPCSGPQHGVCNTTVVASGVCVCELGWKGVDCSVPQCLPLDHNGRECSGIESSNTDYASTPVNVCNNQTNVTTCECWRAICNAHNSDYQTFVSHSKDALANNGCPGDTDNCFMCGVANSIYQRGDGTVDYCKCYMDRKSDPLGMSRVLAGLLPTTSAVYTYARYGATCESPFLTACGTSNSTYCAGRGACYADSGLKSNDMPRCHCPSTSAWTGQYCDRTRCGNTPINDGNVNDDGCGDGKCTGDNGQCICQNTQFPMSLRGSTGKCDIPVPGCTSLVSGTSNYAICNNNLHWCTQKPDLTWKCTCPTSLYAGTYCETRIACPVGCSQTGSRCVQDALTVCTCHNNYIGANCTIDVCRLTGGTPTGPNDCTCPPGSTLTTSLYPGRNACRKMCPVSLTTGHECGLGNDTLGVRLCANLTIPANSTRNATCSCTGRQIADPNNPGQFLALTRNPSTRLCEPICLNGAADYTSTGSPCTCDPNLQWTGARCNIDRCSGRGKWINQRCVCNSRVMTSQNCSTTICDGRGVYVGGTNCQCNGPFWQLDPSTGGCVPACVRGTANTVARTCSCPPMATGRLCDDTLCDASKGGVPSVNYSFCLCTLPQWGGRYCNVSQCVNGGTALAAPAQGCSCLNSYYVGTLCQTEVCSLYSGRNNGLTGSSGACVCNLGYGTVTLSESGPTNGLKVCSKNLCGSGFLPVACNSTSSPPCKFPQLSYTCKCGQAATFASASQGCVSRGCNNGYMVLDPTAISVCVCFSGWTGPSCLTKICPVGAVLLPNETCACPTNYAVSTDGTRCVAQPVTCVNGVLNTQINRCTCNAGFANLVAFHNMTAQASNGGRTVGMSVSETCMPACNPYGTQSVAASGACVCKTNYYGDTCESGVSAATARALGVTDSSLSTGSIVGIAIGSAAFVGLLVLGVTVCYFRKNRTQQPRTGTERRPLIAVRQAPPRTRVQPRQFHASA